MNKEEHIAEAQRLFIESKTEDSSPTPWKFAWDGDRPPTIFDANGKPVCVLSTGTLSGAYENEEIIANAKRIMSGNE
jgi:hypothetical protein